MLNGETHFLIILYFFSTRLFTAALSDIRSPVNTCLATDDPYLLESTDKYDAVMFHWPSLCDYPYVSSRSQHQLFVMVIVHLSIEGYAL